MASLVRLWNGDLSIGGELVTADFRVHADLMDGSDSQAIRGPEGLADWIAQTRAAFPHLTFTTEVGPVCQGSHLAGHRSATGTYQGGFPGAKVEHGTVVSFTGTGPLRLADGKIAEYWVNTDTLLLA